MDPLSQLFGGQARLKLMRLFLLGGGENIPVAEAAKRAVVSLPAARKELAGLVRLGILQKKSIRGKAQFSLNQKWPYIAPLATFFRQTSSLSQADVKARIARAGRADLLVLSGIFTDTVESPVDLLIVGERLKEPAVERAIRLIEAELGAELRWVLLTTTEFRYRIDVFDRTVRDVLEHPHLAAVDRLGVSR